MASWISSRLISFGSIVQHSEIGKAGVETCKITENYEGTLNLVRAYKSFTEFAIKLPSYANPFLESLGRNFQHYVADFNIPVSKEIIPSLDGLKPLGKCLGALRDGYTFLELPLRIKKLCDPKAWDPEKAKRPANEVYTKLVSMLIQIPQKLVESALLIPNTYGLIDLAKHCTRFGTLTGTALATPTFVFGIKEVCVLSASIFSAISYTLEIGRHEGVLKRKNIRKQQLENVIEWDKDKKKVNFKVGEDVNKFATTFQNQENFDKRHVGKRLSLDDLKDRISQTKNVWENADKAKIEAQTKLKEMQDLLAPYATRWNPIRLYRQRQVDNAKITLDESIENANTRVAEYKAACNRYVRRYAQNDRLESLQGVPGEVKTAVENTFQNLPKREERLERIFEYKYLKNDVQLQNANMGINRGTYARRFDISKAAIVSLSLLTITGAMVIPALVPFTAAVEVATWIAVGVIGYTGYRRTTFLASEYREKKLSEDKEAKYIFENTETRKSQKTFV